MSGSSATARTRPLLSLPSNPVVYVAVVGALVSAGIHLLLAPRVMGFSQTMGILFYLNGLGFVGGVALLLSRYWRRELSLVAAGYALVTVVAFFVMSGRVNALSVASKVAEVVVAVVAVSLYTADGGS
ncbi:DUF7475 family protein [Salinigranum halophilum]|uniref:DUF7475 family protein n=1 Tax=Salinigranum halophilum TaxID=2565931 RepID=UPI0010A756CB|nr:hypothetical protein [Salinigranum halophilum]